MGNIILNYVIRICQKGPPLDKFDARSALKKFMETKDRCPNQSARKRYKPPSKENVVETLMDVESTFDQLFDENEDMDAIDVGFDEVMDYKMEM